MFINIHFGVIQRRKSVASISFCLFFPLNSFGIPKGLVVKCSQIITVSLIENHEKICLKNAQQIVSALVSPKISWNLRRKMLRIRVKYECHIEAVEFSDVCLKVASNQTAKWLVWINEHKLSIDSQWSFKRL